MQDSQSSYTDSFSKSLFVHNLKIKGTYRAEGRAESRPETGEVQSTRAGRHHDVNLFILCNLHT